MRKSKGDNAVKSRGYSMRFRRGCFFITAMLLTLLTCLVFLSPTTFIQNDSDTELLGGLGDFSPEEIALLLVVFTAPVSIPGLLLMGWRNHVGLKNERRHLEELAALKHEQGDEPHDH